MYLPPVFLRLGWSDLIHSPLNATPRPDLLLFRCSLLAFLCRLFCPDGVEGVLVQNVFAVRAHRQIGLVGISAIDAGFQRFIDHHFGPRLRFLFTCDVIEGFEAQSAPVTNEGPRVASAHMPVVRFENSALQD
jgi:hypothetical protein